VKDTKPILTEVDFGTWTPKEVIKRTLKLALKTNTRLICVESVAYQKTLLFWFNDYCEENGISGFHFMPVSPRNQAKNVRIKKGVIKLTSGEIYVHKDVRSLVVDQYKEWNPLKRNNKDDIIDPIGYIEEVMVTYPEFIPHQIFSSGFELVDAAHSDSIEMAI
jgi:hypothetical protein